MSSSDPTSRAADLAERILDEVSSAHQDWHVIAASARELADLAETVSSGVDPQAPDA